jgi:hypothetical protein
MRLENRREGKSNFHFQFISHAAQPLSLSLSLKFLSVQIFSPVSDVAGFSVVRLPALPAPADSHSLSLSLSLSLSHSGGNPADSVVSSPFSLGGRLLCRPALPLRQISSQSSSVSGRPR